MWSSFTIHSIGDSAFLEQILIAVAMITGTGDFTAMVSLGLLIGILMITVQAIFDGAQRINVQHILVGWVLYAVMFGPSATVTIEDAYTGQVRPVANVPIGIAAAGATISNVGYTITRLFETGYGVIAPGMMDTPFAESLKLLNDVRRLTADASIFEALNEANGGGYVDLRRSWDNYIRECTLTKIDLGEASVDEIMRSPLLDAGSGSNPALFFNSDLFGTKVHLEPGNPDGQPLTCSSAWYSLVAATNQVNNPLVVQALNNMLGIHPSPYSAGNSLNAINDALQAMGAASTNAVQYAQAAILEPLYYGAVSGRYQDLQDYSSALMINQAIQQRNTQWAAEQTMFMTVVRPMLTFFEGFVYAITPMMAFIIVMGSFGIKLAGKYLQTILWIQLWMPILSITNLFIHTAASGEMASYAAGGLTSMYALASAGDDLQHWIAVGGMLAASTPLISLFVVTGSSYAMTSIAGKLGGSDHIDEKLQSPDLARIGPVMDAQPAYKYNQFSGMLASGAESLMSTMSLGGALNSGISSAKTTQEQASRAFQETLGRGFTDGVSQQEAYNRLENIGRTVSSAGTKQSQLIENQAKQFMDRFGIDQQHAEAVRGAITLNAAANVDAAEIAKNLMPLVGRAKGGGDLISKAFKGDTSGGKSMVPFGAAPSDADFANYGPPSKRGGDKDMFTARAGIMGLAQNTTDDSETWTASDVSSFLKDLSYSESDTQALTSQLAHGLSEQQGETFQKTWGDTLSKELSESASRVVSSAKTFSSLNELRDTMGSMTNSDFRTLGSQVANSPDAMKYLNEYMQTAAPESMRQEAAQLEQRYSSPLYGMDAKTARAAAQLTAMTNTAHTGGRHPEGFMPALHAINMATGRQFNIDSDPYKFKDLAGPNVNPNLEDKVQAATGSGPNLPGGSKFRRQVGGQAEGPVHTPDVIPNTSPVYADNAGGLAELDDRAQQAQTVFSSDAVADAKRGISDLEDLSLSARGFGTLDRLDYVQEKAGHFIASTTAGGKEAATAWDASMEELRNMTPEQLQEFRADLARGDEELKQGKWGEKLLWGAGQIGRGILGAAATGYMAAKDWISGGHDLGEAAKDMSLMERGAFFSAAASQAASAGADTYQQFMDQYGEEYRQTMAELGQRNYGLTATQAAVFGATFGGDDEAREEAVRNLKMEYAERDENGRAMLDANNQPVLSAENEEFTDNLIKRIEGAAHAGDHAGSYLTPIRRYNIAAKQFD